MHYTPDQEDEVVHTAPKDLIAQME